MFYLPLLEWGVEGSPWFHSGLTWDYIGEEEERQVWSKIPLGWLKFHHGWFRWVEDRKDITVNVLQMDRHRGALKQSLISTVMKTMILNLTKCKSANLSLVWRKNDRAALLARSKVKRSSLFFFFFKHSAAVPRQWWWRCWNLRFLLLFKNPLSDTVTELQICNAFLVDLVYVML